MDDQDWRSEMITLADALAEYAQKAAAGQGPVVELVSMRRLVDELGLGHFVRDGGLGGEAFARWVRDYLARTTRLLHPRSLAHQVAVPHPAGALGAMLGAFTNNPMAIYEMGPAAAAIEYFVTNWMLEKVGWKPAPYPPESASPDEHGGGVLTHGGSLANLTALIAARTAMAPDVWLRGNPGQLALAASQECHYSIARAAGIMGIGKANVYPLAVAPNGAVIADRVAPALDRALADGKRLVAVVVNACNTALGSFDPIRSIAETCRARGLWLHVDGAHGASALLSQSLRGRLDGIELADSVVWDAHKLLRTPGLATAVLVRRADALDRAFEQDASYLFHGKEQPGFDFIRRTVECTKSGLGLRVFLVLAALGERGLAAYVERQFAAAREAYEIVKADPEFECPVVPESNILCFRCRGTDELQLAIRDELIRRGSFHLSTVVVANQRYLRLVFMTPETTPEHVELLLAEIRETARHLGSVTPPAPGPTRPQV